MTTLLTCSCRDECKAQRTELQLAFVNYHKYYQPIAVGVSEESTAITNFRSYYAKSAYRSHMLEANLPWSDYVALIDSSDRFNDLVDKGKTEPGTIKDAYNRLWKISEAFRSGKATEKETLTRNFLQSIIYYGNIEASRPNDYKRFHASCFALPTAAVNIYYCFLQQMNSVEEGRNKDPLIASACDMLKVIALQAWTQPFRNDSTDQHVVQIERFRNHVWWVGGNALGYRPLLPVAFMYRSAAMVELVAQVSTNSISVTAQSIYHEAFWTEGITADGAGWGHGKQCLVWGYPIDGTNGALGILSTLKGSPWERTLTTANKEALLTYFRGSNWYYYKGYTLPCLGRGSMSYNLSAHSIPFLGLLTTVITNWFQCFSIDELKELKQLQDECKNNNIQMQQYPKGMYNGCRWFYNNDDLVKKNDDYHLIVNMASSRCDGVESADFADRYNFYMADGMTLFEKDGKEYRSIFGGWDVTASPGVTAREGMAELTPVTNWRGYSSKHNFAGAATSGGPNSAAGFVFEKMNASDKDDVNDKGNSGDKNPGLYGVIAYKAYFIIGDYLIALGAGITNLNPEFPGTIRTTIDQTAISSKISVIENGVEMPLADRQGVFKPGMWVKQAGKFAYTLLPDYVNNGKYICETKLTDWAKMNGSNKNESGLPAKVDILRLWIDHGQRTSNESYGYAVYMGSNNPQTKVPVDILRNDSSIQAVRSKDNTVTGAVFYNSNSVLENKGFRLKVSAPCVLLLEREGDKLAVTITDPAMNEVIDEMVISVNDKVVSFKMPKGKDCGKPVIKRIDFPTIAGSH